MGTRCTASDRDSRISRGCSRSRGGQTRMIRRHATVLRLTLAAVDLVSAIAVFIAVSVARFGPAWQDAWQAAAANPWVLGALYGFSWVVILWLLGLYRLRARWSWRTEWLDLLRAVLLFAFFAFAFLYVAKLPNVSRLFLLELFAAQALVAVGSRGALRLLFTWARRHAGILAMSSSWATVPWPTTSHAGSSETRTSDSDRRLSLGPESGRSATWSELERAGARPRLEVTPGELPRSHRPDRNHPPLDGRRRGRHLPATGTWRLRRARSAAVRGGGVGGPRPARRWSHGDPR